MSRSSRARRFRRFLVRVGLRGLGILNYKTERQSGETNFVIDVLSQIDQEGMTVVDVGADEGNFVKRSSGVRSI